MYFFICFSFGWLKCINENVRSWIGDFKGREISIFINIETGAYIIQITTKNNGTLNKKIIIK